MHYYLITFKSLKEQNPSVFTYLDFLSKMISEIKGINIGDNCFEYDKKGKLHLHIIVFNYKSLHFKKFVKGCFKNDMYCNFVPIKEGELDTVVRYIHKRHTTDYIMALEQKAVRNYYENNYGFI